MRDMFPSLPKLVSPAFHVPKLVEKCNSCAGSSKQTHWKCQQCNVHGAGCSYTPETTSKPLVSPSGTAPAHIIVCGPTSLTIVGRHPVYTIGDILVWFFKPAAAHGTNPLSLPYLNVLWVRDTPYLKNTTSVTNGTNAYGTTL